MTNIDPGQQRITELGDLRQKLHEGKVSRREFMKRAGALGVSATVIGFMLKTYGATAGPTASLPKILTAAQDNPITVTVGGTPIAVAEEDIANATLGGTLRFARAQDSQKLDPVTTDANTEIWIFMNIYDQLLRVAPSGIELEASLAESWEVSEDGLTYTFHLRQGVLFSDGSPFSAKDAVYSLTRAANDPAQTWTFTLTALQRDSAGAVQGITAIDDATLEIVLAQPWAPFLSDLAMFNCSICSEAYSSGNEDKLADQPMGTGPFMLGEWKKGESLQLLKNPNYWETGLPLLNEVMVNVVPDDNNRIIQLQGGDLDAIYDVPSARVPDLKQSGDLQVIEFPSTYIQYITFNTRNAPLNDVNARLALSYATDRKTLVDVVLFGTGVVATTFMPKGALYWNDTIPEITVDIDKAKEYLAASATPDGFELTFTYIAGSGEGDQLAAVLKDMWSQIGVNLTLNPVESGVYTDNYQNHEFESMINYWTNDIIDPDELVAYVILPESSEAYQTGWSNAEAVQLAKDGAAELDPAKRKEIYFKLQEIYAAEQPMLYLYHKPYVDVTTLKVHNFFQPPTAQWVWKKTWVDA
ncbi:ABC transporter substrate-binding protein [soil metagenome]